MQTLVLAGRDVMINWGLRNTSPSEGESAGAAQPGEEKARV